MKKVKRVKKSPKEEAEKVVKEAVDFTKAGFSNAPAGSPQTIMQVRRDILPSQFNKKK